MASDSYVGEEIVAVCENGHRARVPAWTADRDVRGHCPECRADDDLTSMVEWSRLFRADAHVSPVPR